MRRRDLLKLPALALMAALPIAGAGDGPSQWVCGMDFNPPPGTDNYELERARFSFISMT